MTRTHLCPCVLTSRWFFIFSFILISLSGFSQFREVYRGTDENNHSNGASFVTPSTGYVAFTNFIGYTTDSGRSFTRRYIIYNNTDFNGFFGVNLTFGFTAMGVHAFTADSVLAYGEYGFEPAILLSGDKGQNWKLVFHKPISSTARQFSDGVTDVKFPNNGNIGFAIHHEAILRTANRGRTWTTIVNTPGSAMRKLSFPVASIGYAIGGSKMFKTTNSGSNWSAVSLPTTSAGEEYKNVFFTTAAIGYVTEDGKGLVYQTINGGTTWKKMNDEQLNPIRGSDLYFINDSTGFLPTTYLYEVYKTTDGGILWERCKRDPEYQNLNYGMNGFYFLNNQYVWTCGSHEYVQISTNVQIPTMPRALFKVDTAAIWTTGKVHLLNASKKGYQYEWRLNGILVGNAYDASYTHDPFKLKDTLQLIVTNGIDRDTLTLYQHFYPPIIVSSFTPTAAPTGALVTIKGINFSDAISVQFGGRAASSFTVISSTEIRAYVGSGASGTVSVSNGDATGSLPGFVYQGGTPSNLLTLSVADSILCKGQQAIITVQSSETNTQYELIDSVNKVYSRITGTGGDANLIASLPRSGSYYVRAMRIGSSLYVILKQSVSIKLEKTTSAFGSTRVNVFAGESLEYFQLSRDAVHFDWYLSGDPTVSTATGATVRNVSYSAPGQKTLSLISTSANGCVDTVTGPSVYVYQKPQGDDVCYVQNINDEDPSLPSWPFAGISNASLTSDNGYVVTGTGNNSILKSRYGIAKQFLGKGYSYVAKYTTDGVLSWTGHFAGAVGAFYGSATDADGNIYVIGYAWIHSYVHFANGDSLKIAHSPTDPPAGGEKKNGFILKLDRNGNYIWHSVLADHSREYAGYPVGGGVPYRIKIQGNRILVVGDFLAHLTYAHKGSGKNLYTLPNSTTPAALHNNFLIEITTDGNLVWNTYLHNQTNNQYGRVNDIGIDMMGNAYVIGDYEENTTLLDAGNTSTSFVGRVADRGSYLLKLNSTGILSWKVNFTNAFSFKLVSLNSLALDSEGNTYLTGRMTSRSQSDYLTLTTASGKTNNLSFGGYFTFKFNANGEYVWSTGSLFPSQGSGGIPLLHKGSLYVLGYPGTNFSTPFLLTSTDNNTTSLAISETEFFISQYDTEGRLKRVVKSGPNKGGKLDIGSFIVDQKDNYLLTGMNDNGNGGNSNFQVFNSPLIANGYDGFMAKLNPDFCLTAIPPVANAGIDQNRCAGDTATIGVKTSGDSYYWTSQPAGFTSTLANPIVRPTVTTAYYLTVRNSAGFSAQDTAVVTVKAAPNAFAGRDTLVCNGSTVTLGTVAEPGNTYSWTSSPSGLSSSEANPSMIPAATSTYFLSVTNAIGCSSKDTVKISVSGAIQSSVSIQAVNTTNCPGGLTSFKATAINGGTQPKFQWFVNGSAVGNDSTYFGATTLQNNDLVKVVMTSSGTCQVSSIAESNILTVNIRGTVEIPSVTINASDSIICSGTSVRFSAFATNGGPNASFIWLVDGVRTGTGGDSYTTSTLKNKQKVSVVLSSTALCPVPATDTSNVITMQVTAMAKPDVSISSSAASVCQGATVKFSAIVQNGGSNPSYQWYVNNIAAGIDSNVFSSQTLNDLDRIRVVVNANSSCGALSDTSNTVTVNVTARSISTGKINTAATVCNTEPLVIGLANIATELGAQVELWESVNGGSYQSKGKQVYSNTSVSFTIPSSNQEEARKYFFTISPVSSSCYEAGRSDTASVQIKALVNPEIRLDNNTFQVTNPDMAGLYRWQASINGSWRDVVPAVAGLQYTPDSSGIYRVRLEKATCLAYSNALPVVIDNIPESKNVYLYPNPTTGLLIIDSLNLSDNWESLQVISVDNGQVFLQMNIVGQTKVELHLEHLAGGMYMVLLRRKDGTLFYKKFIKV